MSDPGLAAELAGAERAIEDALAAILPPDIRFACRSIRPGDRALLLPDEATSISSRKDHMRDASGAARHLARGLLADMGMIGASIIRAESGVPLWPAGIVGSLAHDDDFAVAAIASESGIAALGLDVEPAEPLAREVEDLVKTAGDVIDGVDETLATRLLFAAKEAVYKAVFPRDRVILGFEDVVVDLKQGVGRTRAGRTMQLVWCLEPRIVAIAFQRA